MTVMAAGAAEKVVASKAAASTATKSAATKEVATKLNPSGKDAVTTKTGNKNNNKTIKRRASNAKRSFAPSLRPAKSTVRYRQILIAEFIVAAVIVVTAPAATTADDFNKNFTGDIQASTFAHTAEQLAMLIVVFFILSTFTVAGPSAARTSAAIGSVILLTLLVKQPNLITRFLPPNITGGGDWGPNAKQGPKGGGSWGPDSLDQTVNDLTGTPAEVGGGIAVVGGIIAGSSGSTANPRKAGSSTNPSN
jgi:hypothetical protein